MKTADRLTSKTILSVTISLLSIKNKSCTVQLTERLLGTIVGPTGRSDPGYVRLSARPVGQTGRTDCSRTARICPSNKCGLLADYNTAYAAALVVRLASPTGQCGLYVRPVGRKVHTLRQSDRLSDEIKHA